MRIAALATAAVLLTRFGRWREAGQFAQVALKLLERPEFSAVRGVTYATFAMYVTWVQHLRDAIPAFRQAWQYSVKEGVLNFACMAVGHIVEYRLILGDPLSEVAAEAEEQMAFTRPRDKMVFPIIADLAHLVASLREQFSPSPSYLSADLTRSIAATARSTGDPWVPAIHSGFAILLQLLREEFEGAVASAREGAEFAVPLYVSIIQAEHYFYAALAFAAHYEHANAEQRQEYLRKLHAYQQEYEQLQAQCPQNFLNRYALISAEVARIEGRPSMPNASTSRPFTSHARTASYKMKPWLASLPRAFTGRAASNSSPRRTCGRPETAMPVGQQMTALGLSVENLRRRISEQQREAREQAARIHDQVATLASWIRNLSHELHPTMLDFGRARRRPALPLRGVLLRHRRECLV